MHERARPSVLVAVLLGLAWASDVPAQVGPATRLDLGSPPGSANSDGARAAAADGAIHAVWRDQRNGPLSDVFYNRSLDGGESWLDPDLRLDGNAPGAGSSTEPRICAHGDDVHVVWRELTAAAHDVHYRVSHDRGRSFGPVQRLDLGDPPGRSDSADIAIACEGALVCAVWADARNGGLLGHDIYANRSTDRGDTWLAAPVRVDLGDPPGASQSLRPAVALTGGDLHVAWEDGRSVTVVGPDVYANRSHDGGVTWASAAQRLDAGSPIGTARATGVRIAAEGRLVCAVWQDQRNGAYDIYANVSSDRGTTWAAADVRLDSGSPGGASLSEDPRVVVSGGAIYVAWRDTASPGYVHADIHFNRSLDGGASWLPRDVRLDDGTAAGASDSRDPSLVAEGPEVFVGWSDSRDGNYDIYVDRSLDSGSTWSPGEVRVDGGDPPGAAESRAASLAMYGGAVHAVWQDRRHSSRGYHDVYHALVRGFRSYGSGTAGSGGLVPRLAGAGSPGPGSVVRFEVGAGLGGAPAVFLLAADRATYVLDLGTVLVALPCVSVPASLSGAPAVPGAGRAALVLTLPAALLGTPVRAQCAVLDPAARRGIALSAGLELWIR